jgi:hypothetical protein
MSNEKKSTKKKEKEKAREKEKETETETETVRGKETETEEQNEKSGGEPPAATPDGGTSAPPVPASQPQLRIQTLQAKDLTLVLVRVRPRDDALHEHLDAFALGFTDDTGVLLSVTVVGPLQVIPVNASEPPNKVSYGPTVAIESISDQAAAKVKWAQLTGSREWSEAETRPKGSRDFAYANSLLVQTTNGQEFVVGRVLELWGGGAGDPGSHLAAEFRCEFYAESSPLKAPAVLRTF